MERGIGQIATQGAKEQESIEQQGDKLNVTKADNYILNEKIKLVSAAKASQGQDAAQYSPYVKDSTAQKTWENVSKTALSMGTNTAQQAKIQQNLDKYAVQTNGELQPIVAQKNFQYASKTAIDNVTANINQANSVYDASPAIRDAARNAVADASDKVMQVMGKGTGTDAEKNEWQLNRDSHQSSFDRTVVQRLQADGKPDQALGYIKGLEKDGKLSGEKVAAMMPGLQKAVDTKDATTLFNTKLKYNTDAQGYPNEKFINDKIQNDTALTDDQKQTYTKIIAGEIGKQKTVITNERNNRFDNFNNILAKERTNPNTSLQAQLAIVPRMGGSQFDQEQMRNIILKPYTDKSGLTINFGGSSAQTAQKAEQHLTIKDDILHGRLTDPTTLDKLATSGVLDAKQHVAFINLLNTTTKSGLNKPVLFARDQIQQRAIDVYGDATDPESGVKLSTQFMNNMDEANPKETDPAKLLDYAKKNLEPEQKDPSTFWKKINQEKPSFFGDRPETDLQDKRLVDSLTDAIGKEPYNAILSSLKKDNPDVGTKEFESFLQRMGNVPLSDISRGTPINNTMRSIIQWNATHPNTQVPFTPEKIKQISESTPNGYF